MNTEQLDTFTLDELLEALRGATAQDTAPDAIRMAQLVETTGRTELSLSKDIRRLIEAGRVECVKVPFVRIDGVRVRVPAYRAVQL